MPSKVFISHSSKDSRTAEEICAALEEQGIHCWIAPRDISPGDNWSESIIDALNECELMVMVFSSHANASKQVMREIERCVHKEVPIIPFRIEDVLPSKSLEYFLSTPHWLDALTYPMAPHVRKLTEVVTGMLSGGQVSVPSFQPEADSQSPEIPQAIECKNDSIPVNEWGKSKKAGLWARLIEYITRE